MVVKSVAAVCAVDICLLMGDPETSITVSYGDQTLAEARYESLVHLPLQE